MLNIKCAKSFNSFKQRLQKITFLWACIPNFQDMMNESDKFGWSGIRRVDQASKLTYSEWVNKLQIPALPKNLNSTVEIFLKYQLLQKKFDGPILWREIFISHFFISESVFSSHKEYKLMKNRKKKVQNLQNHKRSQMTRIVFRILVNGFMAVEM